MNAVLKRRLARLELIATPAAARPFVHYEMPEEEPSGFIIIGARELDVVEWQRQNPPPEGC